MRVKVQTFLSIAILVVFPLCSTKVSAGSLHLSSVEIGKYENTVDECTAAIRVNPNNAQTYSRRGEAYGELGQYEKALADCNEAIKLDAKVAAAYVTRGRLYCCYGGQKQKAIADFMEAIRLDPDNAGPYGSRGLGYDMLGQYQKAIDDYSQVIRLNAKNALAYSHRGADYVNLGQYQKGIDDCNLAISLDDKLVPAYIVRACAYGKLGQYQKQINDSSRAIGIDPKCYPAYVERGFACANLKEYARALSNFGMAILATWDATTWAVWLPSLMLYALLGAVAHKLSSCSLARKNHLLLHNRFWLIISRPPQNYYPHGKMQTPVSGQIAIYLVSLCWAGCVMSWCISNTLWEEQLHCLLGTWITPLSLYSMVSIVCSAPLLFMQEAMLHRLSSASFRKNVLAIGSCLFHTFLFASVLLWLLPTLSLFMLPITSFDYDLIMSGFVRSGVALSTLPLSLSGMAVLLVGAHVVFGPIGTTLPSDYKLLTSHTFSIAALEGIAYDRLHDLVSLALKIGDLEKADRLSLLCLERAEC